MTKKQGNGTDVELYNALRAQFPDLSFLTVNKTLMDLELEGLIHVFTLTKNQWGVELLY
ncbi:MAG: hypothetical protein JSV76_07445 [Candidatus Bathyarchaeota archaeon]|nr:MAG: hypothetical protein JSV76_07445 [Candidatus Bathyarchaeota archaeon]